MNNFTYYNPVKIVFGKNTISKIGELIEPGSKILITYGGGSIKSNGVYDQVMAALTGHKVFEFGGIEANPDYATLMKAVEICKNEGIDFLLSVGGGSVLDGTKFVAAAVFYDGDPWEILTRKPAKTQSNDGGQNHTPSKKAGRIDKALPIGSVLTLAATGSEMNGFAVISRRQTGEKLSFGSPLVFPRFSVLDPQTTLSLPFRQSANGIVDAFIHVMEQYMTYDVNTPLQDRQAEAILRSLVECAGAIKKDPGSYDTRANIMWCATQALNGLIGCGVIQDWATHHIGHELTAALGLDHARSLAIVFPAVIQHQRKNKFQKFIQYGKRVWHIIPKDENDPAELDKAFDKTLARTLELFHSLDFVTRLGKLNMALEVPGKDPSTTNDLNEMHDPEKLFDKIAGGISSRGVKLGEHKNLDYAEIKEILRLCW